MSIATIEPSTRCWAGSLRRSWLAARCRRRRGRRWYRQRPERGRVDQRPRCRGVRAGDGAYLGIEDCLGVGNGTDALELAIRGAGIPQARRSSCRPTLSSLRPRRSCVPGAACGSSIAAAYPPDRRRAGGVGPGRRCQRRPSGALVRPDRPLETIEARLAVAGVVLVEMRRRRRRRSPRPQQRPVGDRRRDELLSGQEPRRLGDAGAVLTNDRRSPGGFERCAITAARASTSILDIGNELAVRHGAGGRSDGEVEVARGLERTTSDRGRPLRELFRASTA